MVLKAIESELGNSERAFARMREFSLPESGGLEPCFCKARGMGSVKLIRGLA